MTDDLAGLRTEVAALRAELRALADRQAIAALIARYGPAVDRGDSAAAAALWAEDGVYDLGALGEARGHAAIAGLFEAEMHQSLVRGGVAHLLGSPSITVSGDEAVAVCHSVVARRTGTDFELYRVAANRWWLRRGPEGWRIVRRVNRLLDGAAAARDLLAE